MINQMEQDARGNGSGKWFHIGATNNGFFPLVDFQQGNILVSLKTINTKGTGWINKMQGHIKDLARGHTVNNQQANMILDLRVQPGGKADARSLIQYGRNYGVTVKIKEI